MEKNNDFIQYGILKFHHLQDTDLIQVSINSYLS